MTTVNAVLDLNPPAPGRARAAAGSLSAGSESARARCGIRVGERQRHSLASAESGPGPGATAGLPGAGRGRGGPGLLELVYPATGKGGPDKTCGFSGQFNQMINQGVNGHTTTQVEGRRRRLGVTSSLWHTPEQA